MKILSNKQLRERETELNTVYSELKEAKEQYKKAIKFYDDLLDNLYKDLLELDSCLKFNIGKEKIKIRVKDMIIKIGGKR